MSDYTKATKIQLIEELEQMKHLSKAVEVKDAEISKLTEKVQSLEELVSKQKHLAKAVEFKEAELAKEKSTFETAAMKVTALQEELKSAKEEVEVYKQALQANTDLQEKHSRALYLLEQYILAYRSTLQSVQGTVDNAIALDNLLKERLK